MKKYKMPLVMAMGFLGLIGASNAAYADFFVLCPNTSVTAKWTGTAAGLETRVFYNTKSINGPAPAPTINLQCFIDAPNGTVTQETVSTQGSCIGGARFSQKSAVHGRPEVFKSALKSATGVARAGTCTLSIPLRFLELKVAMSKPCKVLSNGWSCPNTAVQTN